MKAMIQNLEALGKGVYKAIVVRSLSVVVVLMLPITLTCITFDWLLRTTQEFRWMVLVLWLQESCFCCTTQYCQQSGAE